MKSTLRLTGLVISVALALGMVTAVPRSVSAASDTGRKYQYDTYGEYDLFTSTSTAASYAKSCLIEREREFTFYLVSDSSFTRDSVSSISKDIIKQACAHDPSNSSAGDYLEKAYPTYVFSFIIFGRVYNGKSLVRITYDFTYYSDKGMEASLDSGLDGVIRSLNLGSRSDYEKVYAIYNWIATNTQYDHTNEKKTYDKRDPLCYTAYNAYFKHTAVCQGVATLFYKMLLKAGIDNRIVYGTNHCWNIVRVDGKYYHCDVTWDLGRRDFYNFLKGSNTYFTDEHNISGKDVSRGYSISADDYNSKAVTSTTNSGSAYDNVSKFVCRLYTVALGREAEESGKVYWTDLLVSKKVNGADAAKMFIISQEFSDRRTSNEQYVKILYDTFFDRPMDDGGRDYWTNLLNNGHSRESVLMGFINSKEWNDICNSYGIESGAVLTATPSTAKDTAKIKGFAERLYTKALNREAEASGLEYWTDMLVSGKITGKEAAYKFVFSQEFKDSNVSNEEFVMRLYRLFMDREYDQSGFDYWVGELNNGVDRNTVFNGFSGSEEFGNICDSVGIAR
ncbi:MAG: DUF4214 domain-containing protein [Clostridiales bacterium]|nr:DUF4214 domain-containing protein [Clostridiales bacterium]